MGRQSIKFFEGRITAVEKLPRAIRPHMPVSILLNGAALPAHVIPIGVKEIRSGDEGFIQLWVETDAEIKPGMLFRLHDVRSGGIIGDGRTLMVSGKKLSSAEPVDKLLSVLKRLHDDHPKDDVLAAILEMKAPNGVTFSGTRDVLGWSPEDTFEAVCSLTDVRISEYAKDKLIMDDNDLKFWRAEIIRALKTAHINSPESQGLKPDEIKAAVHKSPSIKVIKAVLDDLTRTSDISSSHGIFRMADFTPKVSGPLAGVKGEVFEYYKKAGAEPPRVRTAANDLRQPEKRLLGILVHLTSDGYLIRLDKDTFLSKEYFDRVLREAMKMISSQGDIDISEFRDMAGCSRRVALLMLERFDKRGWTDRHGDVRTKGQKPVSDD